MLNLRLHSERGSALVPALLVMVMLLTFGVATAASVDTDQADSRHERERESSFQLTEGVLNAQIFQLSTRWPGATASAAAYPSSCVTGSVQPDCPTGAAMAQHFNGVDYASGVQWVTQVRDNGGGTPNYWTDALLTSQPSYDLNDDNFLWVRASGVVRDRRRTLVALVEAENVNLNFPRAALVSGHFETSNSGNKIIIDTNGEANQFSPGDIIVRCTLGTAGCDEYDSGQGPDRAEYGSTPTPRNRAR